MTPAALRRMLDVVSLGMYTAVTQAVRLYLNTRRTADDLDVLISAIYPVITAQRAQAYMLATNYLAGQFQLQGGAGEPFVPSLRDYEPDATRKAVVGAMQRSADNPADAVAKALQVHVEDAVRSTVADAAHVTPDQGEQGRQPKAWARMLTGVDNCAFCVTLASRGPVYGSRKAAGGELNRFHPNCDCVAVPVYDLSDWPGKDVADELAQFYRTAVRAHRSTHALNAVRRELADKPDVLTTIVPDLRSAA